MPALGLDPTRGSGFRSGSPTRGRNGITIRSKVVPLSGAGSLPGSCAALRGAGSILAVNRNVRAVPIGRVPPTVFVIIGHALLGERLHLFQGTGGLRLL
jgi:hypothetical protein